MEDIPVMKPLIEQEEIEAAKESLELGWLGMGNYVGQFEEEIHKYIEAPDRFVAAINTGTSALHIGTIVAGIGLGDEVILPALNFVAGAQAVLASGAEVVFCDVDDKTLCLDLEQVETLITSKTKAIMPVDYSCNLCDHDHLTELANKYNLRVIHDAAHSFGSKYKGNMIGSFSDICMFSFDPLKTITCIDGGMLVVRTEEELQMVQELRLVGMAQPSKMIYGNQRPMTRDVRNIGFRCHMPNLHAAIGLAQLQKVEGIIQTRRAACLYYNNKLSAIPEIKTPQSDFIDIVPFLYYIRVPKDRRDPLRTFLQERGIGTGLHWLPIHYYTLLKSCRKGDLSVSEQVGDEIITLPMHPHMATGDQDNVIENLVNFFE